MFAICSSNCIAHHSVRPGSCWQQHMHSLLHPVLQVLALTFDDGPESSGLNPVLDVLVKHGVKATFFWNTPNLQPGAPPAHKVSSCAVCNASSCTWQIV